MQHAVRTNDGVRPGLGADHTSLTEEGHGLGEQLIEALHGDGD